MSTIADRFVVLDRFAPLAGVLAVVLWVVGLIVADSGDTPDADATPDAIAQYFQAESGAILAGSFLFMLGVAAFVWFLGTLRARYRLAEGDPGRLTSTVFGTGVLTAALSMAFIAPGAAAAFSADNLERTLDPGAAEALWILGDGFFIAAEAAVVVFFLAAGLAALRTRALPAWLGWGAIILGIGAVFPWVGWAALIWGLPLWVLAASVWTFMRPGLFDRVETRPRRPRPRRV